MTRTPINYGTAPEDGLGAILFTSFQNTDNNFIDLYENVGGAVKIIREESDFPAPVGGVITLEPSIAYDIVNHVVVNNRFQVAHQSSIIQPEPHCASLTYTGTGPMFTGSDVNFNVLNASISAPSSSEFFNITDTIPNVNSFSMRNSRFLSPGKFGTFNNLGVVITHFVGGDVLTDGITITGAGSVLSLDSTLLVVDGSGTCLDLGSSTFPTFEINNIIFVGTAPGATGIAGLTASGNVPSGSMAQVTNCEFLGELATSGQLAGVSISDLRWNFTNNAGLSNSTKTAGTYLTTPEVVTITVATQFETINGTNWSSDIAERFSASTSGVLTYLGEQSEKFLAFGTSTIEKVGGGSDQLEMRIAINGAAEVKTGVATQNSDPTSIPCQGIFELNEGDTIELQVANNTGTSNANIIRANLTIINGF